MKRQFVQTLDLSVSGTEMLENNHFIFYALNKTDVGYEKNSSNYIDISLNFICIQSS